ncbi:head maturation protease, ClpP-related [Enterococcus thailandicus]|uniref:head maturation protease, ClpP-related n=1 Tax=Enterococcus thailandicus TaxID=417368 RepID=UPI0039A66130
MKTFLAVKNEGEVPQIFIQGFIGSSWFFEGNTDKKIKRVLDELGNQKEIDVVINSNGGDVFQGIAIGNILKSNKAKINIVINGLAASAASIIAMAGDTVKIYNNAQLMIHRASTYGEGNVDEFRTIADQLESIDKSVKASYKKRFSGSDEELQNLLVKETFMDAETAKNYGLVDEIIDAEEFQIEPNEEDLEEEAATIVEQVNNQRELKFAAFTNALQKTFGKEEK